MLLNRASAVHPRDCGCRNPLHVLAFGRIGLCVFGIIVGCRRISVVINSRLPMRSNIKASVQHLFGCSPALRLRVARATAPEYLGIRV